MAKTFRIDIQEPIWTTKSVGINLSQCNPDDIVEVHILYVKKKTGIKSYPWTYLMMASEVNKYPSYKKNSKTTLHIVPIKDFEVKYEE